MGFSIEQMVVAMSRCSTLNHCEAIRAGVLVKKGCETEATTWPAIAK
jgi:hypothetical protein